MTDLKPQEVAADMNISLSQVYDLINGKVKVKVGKKTLHKKLPAYKAGARGYRIRPAELEAFKCAWSNIEESGVSIEDMDSRVTPFILKIGK